MRRLILSAVLLPILSVTLVFARTSPQESALARAPEASRGRQNPFGKNESARLAGRKLFLRYCAECHGKTGQGTEEAPSLLPASAASPGSLQWFIRNGDLRSGMPSWSRLPDPQVWQIVAYLKTLAN